jgi:hypothetical protein
MCDNGRVWATDTNHLIHFRTGVNDNNPHGDSWQNHGAWDTTNGKLEQISCGYHQQVWGTTQSNHVYYREGINSLNVEGTTWTREANKNMLYVSVGLKGAVWGVGLEGKPFRRTGITNMTPHGDGWEQSESAANFRQLEAGDCQVYATTNMHEIYRLHGCSSANPQGDGWEEVRGTLRHIAVGEGPVLWGVDYAHQVWFKSIGEARKDVDEDKDQFWEQAQPTDRNMVQLDVGRDGHVWAVGSDGTVFYREGITMDNRYGTVWEAQPKDEATAEMSNVAEEVAICTNGNVWMRGVDNKLYYRMRITDVDQKGQEWVLDETVGQTDIQSISCGKDGQFAFVQDNQVHIKNEVNRDDPAGLLSGTSTL